MYRCLRAGTAFAAAALACAAASAQVQRVFPATALRGDMSFGQPPEITLNGVPTRLSPGSRVRGPDNMLQMTGALLLQYQGARLVVNYTLNNEGAVQDVWLLRPEEAAVRPWPRNPREAEKWSFDPTAQTWSKP